MPTEDRGGGGARVLLAEDDRAMQALLSGILADEGYEVDVVTDGVSAIARLESRYDVVLTDLRMPRADGIEVLAAAQRKQPGTPVIVITAFGSIPSAVDAMRLGAFDYLSKPLPSPQTLRDCVERALASRGPASDAATSASGAASGSGAGAGAGAAARAPRGAATGGAVAGGSRRTGGAVGVEPVAVDPKMRAVIDSVDKVAARDTTVLLLGESGTGKEVVARLLHDGSERRSGPFVPVNCAALSESLLESELFGHEKGAFTGADQRREGRFVQADGGTLFLDEMGETSPGLQAKLLRALQERTFERVGGVESVTVDVRIIAATNRDLEKAVESGEFRQDLYYRLAVFPITIPPLRQRPADIQPLAEHFLELLAHDHAPATLSDETVQALIAHDWPGNVRELQNVIERALVLAAGDPLITPDLLNIPSAQKAASAGAAVAGGGTLKDMERRAVAAALAAEGGNRRKAAKRLGIALRTLQYKIKEYGLK